MKENLNINSILITCIFILLINLSTGVFAEMPHIPPYISSHQAPSLQPQYDPGVLLILVDDINTTQRGEIIASAHSSIGATIKKEYSHEGLPGLQLISLPSEMNVSQATLYYSKIPGVRFAEPDYYRYNDKIPNDPEFWRQWGLLNSGLPYKENIIPGTYGADIKASEGWNISTGDNCIVAILDTGVDYLHPDLRTNIWNDSGNDIHGYDAITGILDPMDLDSHGTHSAGIIGAIGNNEIGVSGVNWNTTILPVRFLNSFGTGTVSNEIASILWASQHGAKIISCSFGGTGYSQAEYEVISQTDALFICAAGNGARDTDSSPYYPASYDLSNIISVAATDPDDNLAFFSNYGKISVDLGAPGVDSYSTTRNLYTPAPLWHDSFNSLENWTIHGNWTLDSSYTVTPPYSASGIVNRIEPESPDDMIPIILSLKDPVHLWGLQNPIISFYLSMVGKNFSYRVEASRDNLSWKTLEYTTKSSLIMPFERKECKIPQELLGGDLFIRFVADGDYIYVGLDDIVISDGYGDITGIRYDYMTGTSMACPYVSGTAALLLASAPNSSIDDIKRAILDTVDQKTSLEGKTASGGRLNLSAAINQIIEPEKNDIPIFSGWNCVSIPMRLQTGNDTALQVFGQITNTSGHSVLKYLNNSWVTLQPDEQIRPLSAYWIWTGTNQYIPLIGDSNQSGVFSQSLKSGWNSFGVVGNGLLTAKEQMDPIKDTWKYIIGYNSSKQNYDEPIIQDGTGNTSDSQFLYPKQGYWLYVMDDIIYCKEMP